MNIERRDFIRAGGMLALVGGSAAIAGAAEAPAGMLWGQTPW